MFSVDVYGENDAVTGAVVAIMAAVRGHAVEPGPHEGEGAIRIGPIVRFASEWVQDLGNPAVRTQRENPP